MKAIEIHWTAALRKEAQGVATICCRKRLAASVQIGPEIESHYIWKGKSERGQSGFQDYEKPLCIALAERAGGEIILADFSSGLPWHDIGRVVLLFVAAFELTLELLL